MNFNKRFSLLACQVVLLPMFRIATEERVIPDSNQKIKSATLFCKIEQFTQFEHGARSPIYNAVQKLTINGAKSPWFVISKVRLLQIDNEFGIDGYYPSQRFDQVIASVQLGNNTSGFVGLDDLEWVSGDGKHKKRLTHDNAGYHGVVWSPDQKQIVYLSQQGVGRRVDTDWKVKWAVYVQDVTTKKRQRLFEEQLGNTKSNDVSSPQYAYWLSPKKLLYASQTPKGLFLLDVTGKPPVRLTLDVPDAISTKEHRAYWYRYKAHQIQIAPLPTEADKLLQPRTWNNLKPTVTLTFPRIPQEFVVAEDQVTTALTMVTGEGENASRQIVILDLKTRRLRFVGVTAQQIYGLRWSSDRKHLTFLADPHSLDPAKPSHQSIVTVAVPYAEGVPFEQFDWKQTTPLKWTELFALPVGAQQVSWKE